MNINSGCPNNKWVHGPYCWTKNLFDECFNDNKPYEINAKFYEWWSTDICT